MKTAIYPGSFDPVTLGHYDIIERSSKIFDKLIVGVLNNSAKSPLFSVEERVNMLKDVTSHFPNVEVQSFAGLLIDFVRSNDANVIVRGLRAITDFEYDSAKYSAEIVDNMDYLIEDLKALNDSLDVYYPDLQTALDDSRELVRRTTDALNNGISTLTIIQNTLKDSSDDFDAAARDSLRGSMELLDKSLNILDSTTAMRQAGRTMKDTIDNELDKFDTDNRFLFMDPSADKVSFTSDRNKPPKTLQIVMRTDEISVDDDTAKTADAEVAKAKESPLRRMWNVLVQMWKAMVSIFKNR